MSDSESKPSTETAVHGVVNTPGPWEVFGIIGKPGLMHVRACVGVDRVGRKQYQEVPVTQSDARLIAAAPELLEAIQAALRIEPLWMPPDDENNPEYDAEFAALAMMRNQLKAVVAKVA